MVPANENGAPSAPFAYKGNVAFPGSIGNCGTSLAPGGSCTFTVTFAPTFTGTRNATLTISTNSSPSTDFPLTGTGD